MEEFVTILVTIVVIIGGIALFLYFYMLPYSIASKKEHRNKGNIFWVNLLLGITGWGWIVVLIWSMSDDGKTREDKLTP